MFANYFIVNEKLDFLQREHLMSSKVKLKYALNKMRLDQFMRVCTMDLFKSSTILFSHDWILDHHYHIIYWSENIILMAHNDKITSPDNQNKVYIHMYIDRGWCWRSAMRNEHAPAACDTK